MCVCMQRVCVCVCGGVTHPGSTTDRGAGQRSTEIAWGEVSTYQQTMLPTQYPVGEIKHLTSDPSHSQIPSYLPPRETSGNQA